MKKKLTQKLLKEYLHYNPDTGIFTWRVNVSNVKTGSVAGCVREQNGYKCLEIGVLGGLYKAHRLAFLYMTGKLPKDGVDHENGDSLDNRWKNLREATNGVNSKNQKRYTNNTSGCVGVNWDKRDSKWRSKIDVNGCYVYLGLYEDYDEAVLIRKQAEEYYGFHENHGRG